MLSVSIVMDLVDGVYNCFHYPKRAIVLKMYQNKDPNLKRVVLTWWTSAMVATSALKNQLKPGLNALEEIKR